MTGLDWLKNIEDAGRSAGDTGRLVLMFFHHPRCGGCKKSIEITFTDPEVMDLVDRDFVPVSLAVTEAEEMTARYRIEWTPTFIIADEHLRELERWVGYLPPKDFISQLHLSVGLADVHMNRLKEAEEAFSWIIDNRPNSDAAPEARYYLGVSLYKETGDPEHLSRTWDAMNRRYPGNSWTKKASAWSH